MNNKVNHILFLPYIIICIIIFACSKDDDTDEHILPQANIIINTPVENTIIRTGDTLFIKGTASGNQELHGYEIGIRKPGASNLFFQHYHGHGHTITFEENWKNTLNENAEMEMIINVILDHEQHKQNKVVRFMIQK